MIHIVAGGRVRPLHRAVRVVINFYRGSCSGGCGGKARSQITFGVRSSKMRPKGRTSENCAQRVAQW